MRLTIFEKLAKKYLGYKYLVNLRSKQIHDLNNTHHMCHLPTIKRKNVKIVTFSTVIRLRGRGYDYCNFCFKVKK